MASCPGRTRLYHSCVHRCAPADTRLFTILVSWPPSQAAQETTKGGSMKRFELFGIVYFQEHRKCGKETCKTCQDGPGHGPYWWSRDTTGKRKYIGVNLPKDVTEAEKERNEMLGAARGHRARLQRQIDALDRLIYNSPLQDGDRAVFKDLQMGFKQEKLF